jgi:hypothetical protein
VQFGGARSAGATLPGVRVDDDSADKIIYGSQSSVAREIGDTAVKVQAELLGQDLVVGSEAVLEAPLLKERPIELVMRAPEGLPRHLY